jgi:peroxiredoxin
MGLRPATLMPGETMSSHNPIADRSSTVGRAEPGRLQLIVFERGHWCSACRRHLALIAERHDDFTRRAIDIAAITHEHASDLIGKVYPFPVIPDPELAIAALCDIVGDDENGKRTIRPGTIVVDENGVIRFSYVGDDSRDRPTIPALLLAIDALPGTNIAVRVRVPKPNQDAEDDHPDHQ